MTVPSVCVCGCCSCLQISVQIEVGKTLFVKLNSVSEPDNEGMRSVIFELNGQQRLIKVAAYVCLYSASTRCSPARTHVTAAHAQVKDNKVGSKTVERVKADPSKPSHVGAPMPGVVIGVKVAKGDKVCVLTELSMFCIKRRSKLCVCTNCDDVTQVKAGQTLVILSAMKMETSVGATKDGIVASVLVTEGDNVKGGDLVVEIE